METRTTSIKAKDARDRDPPDVGVVILESSFRIVLLRRVRANDSQRFARCTSKLTFRKAQKSRRGGEAAQPAHQTVLGSGRCHFLTYAIPFGDVIDL